MSRNFTNCLMMGAKHLTRTKQRSHVIKQRSPNEIRVWQPLRVHRMNWKVRFRELTGWRPKNERRTIKNGEESPWNRLWKCLASITEAPRLGYFSRKQFFSGEQGCFHQKAPPSFRTLRKAQVGLVAICTPFSLNTPLLCFFIDFFPKRCETLRIMQWHLFSLCNVGKLYVGSFFLHIARRDVPPQNCMTVLVRKHNRSNARHCRGVSGPLGSRVPGEVYYQGFRPFRTFLICQLHAYMLFLFPLIANLKPALVYHLLQ